MVQALNRMIVGLSSQPWAFVAVLSIAVATLLTLFRIGSAFAMEAGGNLPWDLQNGLKSADVSVQLAQYSGAARRLYGVFFALDMIFPLAGGLVFAAIIAFGLRQTSPALYLRVDQMNLWPVLLIATAFDWAENAAALSLIAGDGSDLGVLPELLVAAKHAKLVSLFAIQATAALLLIAALAKMGWQRFGRRST